MESETIRTITCDPGDGRYFCSLVNTDVVFFLFLFKGAHFSKLDVNSFTPSWRETFNLLLSIKHLMSRSAVCSAVHKVSKSKCTHHLEWCLSVLYNWIIIMNKLISKWYLNVIVSWFFLLQIVLDTLFCNNHNITCIRPAILCKILLWKVSNICSCQLNVLE